MNFYNSVPDAINGYAEELGDSINDAFRRLLETKHLYQSVVVEESNVTKNFWERVESRVRQHLDQTGTLKYPPSDKLWALRGDTGFISVVDMRPGAEFFLEFTPPHAKMYCKACQRVEPFNFLNGATTIDAEKFGKRQVIGGEMSIEQVYTLSYLCQSCKKFPEVLLVRRSGGKLTLAGRSPMEHVEVPAVVPKEILKFYSGAVIAYQSGQALAALFMLRTAHEQWVRKWAIPTDKADQAFEKYMVSLPLDFKTRFPSFKDMYGQLSADIHAATGSEELFLDIAQKFVEHFDARRLYKLTEPS